MQSITTVGLCKSFQGRRVVEDVNLRIDRGEVVGLLGPNGAGKTTTFRIIVGLTGPDAGRVLLDETEITRLPMYLRARGGLSYLPQEPSIFKKLTVEENILAVLETVPIRDRQRCERLEELIEDFGLQKVRRSFGYVLSGGERRRAEIARALAISPRFILLDEPFSGIDPLAVLDIQQLVGRLKNTGMGILVTDHNVRETLQVTDRAYIINAGKILRAGTPEELENDSEVRKVYLGDNFRLAI